MMPHPTNLYEIGWLGLLGAGLWLAERRGPLPDGWRFRFFMAGYLLLRLLVEFIKPTPAPSGWGLTAIQWACVAGLGYYGWLFGKEYRNLKHIKSKFDSHVY